MSNKKDPDSVVTLPHVEPTTSPDEADQFAVSDFDIKVEALRYGVDLVAGYHGRRADHKSSPDTDAVEYAKTFEAYLRKSFPGNPDEA